MTVENLNRSKMVEALNKLDALLTDKLTLIIGGGSAMVLAHGFPLSTADIDAVPKGLELSLLNPLIEMVAKELQIAPDWLNPYFSTFAHTLPADYGERLVKVFDGKFLEGLALGKTDMLVMKCFAHRQKDIGHAKALIKGGADTGAVSDHIEKLKAKRIPGSSEALEFLDDLLDQL